MPGLFQSPSSSGYKRDPDERRGDRMRQLRENAGTVFLVSHAMESILETCNRVIWLEKGLIRMDGDPKKVVAAYSKYMEDISE